MPKIPLKAEGYIFLKHHTALIKMFPDQSYQATQIGRVYTVMFLLATGHLTEEQIHAIVLNQGDKSHTAIAFETDTLIADSAKKWLAEAAELIEKTPNDFVYMTDMTYRGIAMLLGAIIYSNEQAEIALRRMANG